MLQSLLKDTDLDSTVSLSYIAQRTAVSLGDKGKLQGILCHFKIIIDNVSYGVFFEDLLIGFSLVTF